MGVEVDENARGTLIAECGAILNDVSSMPADAEFRKQTETLFGYIKKACEDPAIKDDAELEVKVSLGNGVGTAPPHSRALLPGTPPLTAPRISAPAFPAARPWAAGGDHRDGPQPPVPHPQDVGCQALGQRRHPGGQVLGGRRECMSPVPRGACFLSMGGVEADNLWGGRNTLLHTGRRHGVFPAASCPWHVGAPQPPVKTRPPRRTSPHRQRPR